MERARQEADAREYLSQFGGPVPDKKGATLRSATFGDLRSLFRELDADGSGFLDEVEIERAAQRLGFPFASTKERKAAFDRMDADKTGRVRGPPQLTSALAPAQLSSPRLPTERSSNCTLRCLQVTFEEFVGWWNATDERDGLWKKLHSELHVKADWEG